ncbi:hypothetical protein Pan44_25070 [Caulifigura coniformis]|uniref:Terminase-like family protein n=1 Tax=Caulifigura coniformis TaxID=2527983 RepID=A0A517SEC5_9PLAN|nr:hypothetical protein [Caulifigura coniformis]QDT54474.1 hypothetical protein Pan44_25070 [Caulifigura coniformis]
MNIIECLKDARLLRSFIANSDDDINSWLCSWGPTLRALYGLPIQSERSQKFIRTYTGRDPAKLPANGFDTALFLTGRRSGKSRIASVIAAFEATVGFDKRKLSPGERGVVIICSPTRRQSKLIRDYADAIFEIPLFAKEVVSRGRDSIELKHNVSIEIMTGDFRSVRGATGICVVLDEVCFLGVEEDSRIKSDTELVRALKPTLASTHGRLIAISSPYAQRGWAHSTWQKNYANDSGSTLVLQAPSKVMNSTLSQSIIDSAMQDDPDAARAEYYAEWRSDVSQFLPRSVIESLVVKGKQESFPTTRGKHIAFCDIGGGRSDSSALAIAHKEGRKAILDLLRVWPAPCNPFHSILEMCRELRRWRIDSVCGDNYSAEFTASSFKQNNIWYQRSELSKSEIYLEFLPKALSGEVELLDSDLLISQLASLERRVRSGGRDVVDHPPRCHDDASNAACGALVRAVTGVTLGGFEVDDAPASEWSLT